MIDQGKKPEEPNTNRKVEPVFYNLSYLTVLWEKDRER